MRGGALESLPCWGFLFLLGTLRSPRTGLPRRDEVSWEALGRSRSASLKHPHIRSATLQSREGSDRIFCVCVGGSRIPGHGKVFARVSFLIPDMARPNVRA